MPKKNYDETINSEPKPTDRICDFVKKDDVYPLEPSMLLKKISAKIDMIYFAGIKQGLCHGEISLMIAMNFKYYSREIPYGRSDEIKQWIINNAFRNYQILEPERHKEIIQSDNYYSQDFKHHEKNIQPRTEW
jgi:hypothetical protein